MFKFRQQLTPERNEREDIVSAYELLAPDRIPKLMEELAIMDKFSDIYPQSEIDEDKEEVADLHERNKSLDLLKGYVFELLVEHFSETNPLGENTHIIKTSLYDDYHGSDFLIALNNAYIAIDLTTSEDFRKIKDKTERVLARLRNGKLTELKYFYSPETKEHARLEKIPRAIVKIEDHALIKLCQLLQSPQSKGKEIKEVLAGSDLKNFLIGEVYDQLEDQIKFVNSQLGSTNEPIKRQGYKELIAYLEVARESIAEVVA